MTICEFKFKHCTVVKSTLYGIYLSYVITPFADKIVQK